MLKIDHDFYTLSEASRLFGCKTTDFLKLGAADKIDLYFWTGCDLVEGKVGEETYNEITSRAPSFLPMHKNTIMRFYIDRDHDNCHFVNIFKAKKGKFRHVLNGPIPIAANSLCIMGDTLRGEELAPFRELESNNGTKENFPFVDKKHDYFCPHLAVAVEVWLHLYDKRNIKVNSIGQPIKKTFGQQAADYLKEHYPELKGNAFERVISISNPNPNAKAVIEDD